MSDTSEFFLLLPFGIPHLFLTWFYGAKLYYSANSQDIESYFHFYYLRLFDLGSASVYLDNLVIPTFTAPDRYYLVQ